MSRPSNRPGRVTAAPSADAGRLDDDVELPSVRRRRPVMFWTMVLAALAMVLSLVAFPLSILLG